MVRRIIWSVCSIRWNTGRVSERVERDDQRAAEGCRGVICVTPDRLPPALRADEWKDLRETERTALVSLDK